MMYEQVENDDNAPEANHPSIVWDQIEPNSSQPRTPDLNTETTAEDLGQLPQLEITDGTPLLEASADTDDTARLVESSIQELVIAAYEQSAKLPPELGNTKLMEDLKREKESGEFGPASQKAFRILVETMQTMQLPQYLRALTEFGIPVPPGFPSAETNASEGLPLFSRRITAGERLVDLKLNLEKPSVEDVKKLNQVFEWLASADAGIKFHAERREIKFLQSRISELGVKSWEYKEGEDKQAWLQSAKSMVDLTDRVSNTIRAMHYLYKSSAESDFPTSLPEGSSITVVLDDSHHRVTLNKQDLEKAENRSLLKRGTIESIRLDLPADLRVDHLGNKVRIGNLQDWLDTNAKPVTETLMRLSEVRKEPQSIIYWGEDEISQGQAVFNSNGEFTGKLLPKGQTPEPGETTKHVNLVDYDFSVEEIKTGPDKGRLLIRQTIEAADAAPWAYQNIRWLGVDTVGKPLVIQHAPVDKDAFLPVRNGGTIELIQARNLETYRSGRKIASFGEKTVTGFMDTAMVVSGTIELRAAMKASQLVAPGAQAVLKLTERETLGQVNHGLFRVGLGGSGVLNNAGGKELQFGGMSGQDLLTLRSLIFVGEAAKGVGGTFSSALRTAEAPSLTTATEKVRTFIHGQKETALLPALPAWSPAARIHKAAEYTFRGTELALAPQITKELIHQLKELNEEKHSQAADEALSIHERLLGMGKPENGAFDSSSPESIAAARLLLNDYGRMITEGKNQKVKDSVAAIFKEVEKGLQPDTSKEVRAELVNKLAQDLILSKDELVRLEKVHPDFASSDKRQLNDKELSRLLSGSMTEARMTPLVAEYAKILEERKAHDEVNMARTIGLLYLTRSEDGKVPAKIESWLSAPRMEKTYQSESNQYKPKQAVLGERLIVCVEESLKMNEEEAFENANIREQADNRSSNQLTTEALKELSKWKALVASTAATFEFLPSISLYESEQNGPWASDAKSLTASDPSNSFDSLDGSNEDEQISHTPDGPEDNNLANLDSSHGLDNQDNSNGLDNQDSNGLDNQYNSDGLEDPDSPDDRDRNPDDSEINDSRDEKAPSVKTEFGDDFSEKRSFVANGHRVMVKTIPDFKLDNSPYTHSVREVTIDGKRVRLTATAQEWFYSRSAKNLQGDAENMPKIHIRADSPADLAKVQASVIPVLEKLIDQGKIGQYKTFDPNFADVRWSASTSKAGPGPEVQSSKGFTVYLPKEFAVEVSGIIDRALVSQDLKVRFEGNGSVGDTWRKHTASARVSMERANWEFVKPSLNSNRIFHLLDASVEKVLTRKFEKYRDKDGKMSPEGLNEIEKASGVEQGKLAIEPGTGRIALVSRIDRGAEGSPYVDESQANKEPGFKTGRPAMYALHELAGIDPVLAELGAQPDQRSSKEIPKIISKENTAQAKKAVELDLIEVLENTYNKLAHGKTRAEREQARAMLEHLSNSENRETRELAGLVKKAAASSVGIRAEGLEPKTFRELMQEHQIDLEQAKTGRKVLVGVGLGVGFATTLGAGLSWLNSSRTQVAPIRDAAPKIEKK